MDKSNSANPLLSAHISDKLIYLFTRDQPFASYISQQIIHFGYSVQQVRDLKNLANISFDAHSVAFLMDIPADEGTNINSEIFADIHNLQLTSHALLFTSDIDDQLLRMKSIQAGGKAFFTKPIDIISLIDNLDILHQSNPNPQLPRVLIVEDQVTVGSYYQMILKMAGMDTQITSNPHNVLEQVKDFHPDLILLDTFMTEVNTSDLARVIRQIDDFVSIPILFLSSEDDLGKRIEALDLGADDFLIKPIKASYLKAVVRSRLERSRILRSYMVRDSLTNLLNHTSFRRVLAQEVSRSKRLNSEMAVAMLDIDHFKSVNDTFGHAAGDSVLKGLSRLLKQRLRSYDIVGRYGGDEFVVLLIDCDGSQSIRIMNEIREHFSKIEFTLNHADPLYLTFSCGISTFPKYKTAEELSDNADQALYSAKAFGRNQIHIE